jgi:type II secretory pathway pseudopilin PulG
MEHKVPRASRAFTILELVIYIAIFAVIIVAFVGAFVAITRVQTGQSSQAEVESQSQFLLEKIQYYVEQASLIDMPADTPTTTLTLRMSNPAADPTYLTVTNGILYVQQTATGTPIALSSNQVTISSATFTKHSNPPAHDTVSVALTVAYNTSNLQQMFSQAFQTSVARVSAATFDSNLIPSTTAAWNIGVTGNVWNSINQVIYFSGSNVGLGTASPGNQLDVKGATAMGAYAGGSTAPSNGLIVSGNVGIGTSSAASTLTVVGTQYLSGALSSLGGQTFLGGASFSTTTAPGLAAVYVAGQLKLNFLVNATATTASTIIDFSKAERQMVVLGTNGTTIYITNTENGDSDAVKLCQDGTGSRSVSWAASSTNVAAAIDWGKAGPPALSTAANACDWFTFLTAPKDNNNSSMVVDGFYGQNGFSD